MIYRYFLMSFLWFGYINCCAQVHQINNGHEKGTSVDGFKHGVWEYFESDTLKLRIDYETGIIKYLAPDTSYYAIQTDKGWIESKLDIYPAFVGSKHEILMIFYENLIYPIKARQRNRQGTVLIGFEINLSGEAENFEILKDIGFSCGKKVIEVFKKVPNVWLPAHKDGIKYRSRYVLPVRFYIADHIPEKGSKLPEKSNKELKKINEAIEKFLPTNYLDEVIITAFEVSTSRIRN